MFRIILFSITLTSLLLSHGGRTDSNGGHYDRSSGEYHYHNGGNSNENYNQSSSKYILSIFQYKEFKGFGDTFDTKDECMDMRYKLWIENKNEGWTYGCKKDNE